MFGGRPVVPREQNKPPFWRVNYPGRQVFFSGFHMNAQNLPYYADQLRKAQVPWLHGYPSLLALLAAFLLDRNETIGYRLRSVTLMAENAMPHQISLITRAFGVAPRQNYGMAEGVANFSDCELGHLHVDEDYSAVEFIPTDDGSFRVIGSGYSNRAFALLRYDVGDRVRLASGPCRCGRPGRIVEDIDGRQEDYVVLHDGTRVSALNHLFKDVTGVREAQIYQSRVGEIFIRIVRNEQFGNRDEETLLREARSRLGMDTVITLTYLDSLKRTRAGKLRFVISDVEYGKSAG
jgi:phenylacetate-CoA ligase